MATTSLRWAHRSRKDRPSAGLECARPLFSFLALLADVEAATRLDDPDYIDDASRAAPDDEPSVLHIARSALPTSPVFGFDYEVGPVDYAPRRGVASRYRV